MATTIFVGEYNGFWYLVVQLVYGRKYHDHFPDKESAIAYARSNYPATTPLVDD